MTVSRVTYFFLLVLFGIANNVSGRWNQLKFGNNYAFFNNQFYVFNYAVMAQIVSAYVYFFTKEITPDMKAFPIWKFMMFAFFDATAAFMYAIGAPSTPATLQNIINQAIIPFTMIVTVILLKVRYRPLKLVGAGIILIGAFVALIPLFVKGNDPNAPDALWYKILIYFCNNIPQAFSNVTKEMAFLYVTMDVYYLGAWVGWFQAVFTFLLLPVTALPGFGGLPFSQMPTQIEYGFLCFLGINSLPGDECSYNYVATMIYIVINFGYNILILLVTKHASATVFTLAFALRLPLTQIVYCIQFIMQRFVEQFTWESIVSLIVVLIGFGIYSSISEPQQEKEKSDEEKGKIQID